MNVILQVNIVQVGSSGVKIIDDRELCMYTDLAKPRLERGWAKNIPVRTSH